MALETGLAIAGLVVGVASAGYSIYASEEAAKEAEEMADRNAQREAMEAEEMAQRAEKEAAREESLARAKAFASGVGGETTDLYLQDLTKTNKREIDWIRTSGASRAELTRDEGKFAGNAYRREGISAGIAGLGQAVSSGANWYSASGGKPAAGGWTQGKSPSYVNAMDELYGY